MAKKVLIVDYEPKRITEVSNHLAGLPLEVISARDGLAALEIFAQQHPDLVILCAMLPKKHGFQVCQEIKQDAQGAATPVIIHSSVYKGTKHRHEAINTYGAGEYLEYPFTREALMAAVLQLLPGLTEGGGAPAEPQSQATVQMTSPYHAGETLPASASSAELQSATTMRIKASDLPGAAVDPAAAAPAPKKKAGGDLDKLLEDTLSGLRKTKSISAPGVAAAVAAATPAATPAANAAATAAAAVPAKKVTGPVPAPKPPAAPPEPSGAVSHEELFAGMTDSAKPAPAVTAKPRSGTDSELEKRLNDSLSGIKLSPTQKKTSGTMPAPAAPAPAPAPAPAKKVTGTLPAPAAARPAPAPVKAPPTPASTPIIPPAAPAGPPEIRLGNYVLGERIATGGMAELFRARQRGVDGFEKTVAIKRILPHLASNAEFTTMFIDEAKLASQLNHPNIAQIYDLGKVDGTYYIAMEFVDGKDLREISRALTDHNKRMGTPAAGALVAKVLAALDHAHRKKDEGGRSLKLVHRDVSPQNILVSTDGEVKLVDFGIAKAASKASHTHSGALKGKLLYMSPEQAWGKEIDNRSDLFAAGIILWELLAGKRLFAGDSEMSILEKVREAVVPSILTVNPDVPNSLAAILEKALARDRDDRYSDARSFAHELESALNREYGEPPGSAWILSEMHDLFPANYKHEGERRPRIVIKPATAPAPAPPPAPPPPRAEPTEQNKGKGKKSKPPSRPAPVADLAGEIAPSSQPPKRATDSFNLGSTMGAEAGKPSKSKAPLFIGAAVVVAIVVVAVIMMKGGKAGSAASAPPPVSVASVPASSPVSAPAGSTPVVSAPSAPVTSAPVSAAHASAPKSAPVVSAPTPVSTPKSAPASAPKSAPAVSAPASTPASAAVPPPVVVASAPVEPPKPVEPETPKAKAGDFVKAADLDTDPKEVSRVQPNVPSQAANHAVAGTVFVSVTIDETGAVTSAALARGIENDFGLNGASVDAAKKLKFTPGMKDGVPVKTAKTISFKFGSR